MRKEQARLVGIENMKIAKQLMKIKGTKELTKQSLDVSYAKHQRAKDVLCKLPQINYRNNMFSQSIDYPMGTINESPNYRKSNHGQYFTKNRGNLSTRNRHDYYTSGDNAGSRSPNLGVGRSKNSLRDISPPALLLSSQRTKKQINDQMNTIDSIGTPVVDLSSSRKDLTIV